MTTQNDVDATQDDAKIEESDNSGERDMPLESQDPHWIPKGSVK